MMLNYSHFSVSFLCLVGLCLWFSSWPRTQNIVESTCPIHALWLYIHIERAGLISLSLRLISKADPPRAMLSGADSSLIRRRLVELTAFYAVSSIRSPNGWAGFLLAILSSHLRWIFQLAFDRGSARP
jgi:hypothetical protein